MSKKDEILNKILPSSLYTLLFVITDYVLALLLIILDRFDWLRLTIISITGIIVGITAEILIIKFKTNLITYWKSIFSSIIIYVILLIFICIIAGSQGLYIDFFNHIYKLLEVIRISFPIVMSVYWLVKAEKITDKIVLAITNPMIHFNILLHVIGTLLSCLPT